MAVLNIPNTLTIARIVAIPLFVTAVIYGRYGYALAIFAAAALTDMLDGLFARLTNQRTALGTFLDPLADKILLMTSFVLFSVYGWIPKWFAVAVISRDFVIVVGWILLSLITDVPKVEPVVLGKAAIALQLIVLVYVLVGINAPGLPDVSPVIFGLVAAVTVLSGLQYVLRAIEATNG